MTTIQKGLAAQRLGADHNECRQSVQAVQDALYVRNGTWKLPIIIGLSTGPRRFRELQRVVHGITANVLRKALKELVLNEFVVRNGYTTAPITVE